MSPFLYFWLSLYNVARKEMLQTLRDRRMVFMLIAAPMIQLVAFGYAVDLDVDRIPTVVCDQDRTEASRDLGQAFFADGTFTKQGEVLAPDSIEEALGEGRAAVGLVIPRGFSTRLARGDSPDVQVLIDGTDATRAQVAAADATQLLLSRGVGVPRPRSLLRAPPKLSITTRILFNERLRTPIYMLPGIAGALLLNITAIVTAMGLARERETGTLEQVLVTPIRPGVLLAGKCLPFVFFGLIDILAVLFLGSAVFGVPIRGAVVVVLAGAGLYLFSSLGMGILLATVSASQQEAILGAFSFILPAMLLSGFTSPIDAMPGWIQPLTLLNPMRHFLEIIRGALLKGAGFADLTRQFAGLALLGTGILSLSVARFHKRLA